MRAACWHDAAFTNAILVLLTFNLTMGADEMYDRL